MTIRRLPWRPDQGVILNTETIKKLRDEIGDSKTKRRTFNQALDDYIEDILARRPEFVEQLDKVIDESRRTGKPVKSAGRRKGVRQ